MSVEAEACCYMEKSEFDNVQSVVENPEASSKDSPEESTSQSYTKMKPLEEFYYYMGLNREEHLYSDNPFFWMSDYDKRYLWFIQEKELGTIFIMLNSPQLRDRKILVLLMIKASKALEINDYSLHTAVSILDRLMDNNLIPIDYLIPTACVCLLTASKFYMEGDFQPTLANICEAVDCDFEFTEDALFKLECDILKNTDWSIFIITVVTFANFFREFCINDEDKDLWRQNFSHRSDFTEDLLLKEVNELLDKYIESTLSDLMITQIPCSLVAAACIMGVRKALKLTPWPQFLEILTSYEDHQLNEICLLMTEKIEKESTENVSLY